AGAAGHGTARRRIAGNIAGTFVADAAMNTDRAAGAACFQDDRPACTGAGWSVKQSSRATIGVLRFAYCGIADRWKCTIFQSEPRLAITNVTRPGLLKGLSSSTPVEVFNPAMTTAVSDRTMTSDELMGAARGFRVRSAPSKYFRIAAGSVTTVWLPVPMNSASGAFSFTMASTSDAANAFVHSSTTASAS